jgi:hypothetical protein
MNLPTVSEFSVVDDIFVLPKALEPVEGKPTTTKSFIPKQVGDSLDIKLKETEKQR